MELFRIRKDIPFMKHALILNAISIITFVLAVFFLVTKGLHLSVEFTGGTVMEVAYSQPAELEKVRNTIQDQGYTDVTVQNFGTRARCDDSHARAKGRDLGPAKRAGAGCR